MGVDDPVSVEEEMFVVVGGVLEEVSVGKVSVVEVEVALVEELVGGVLDEVSVGGISVVEVEVVLVEELVGGVSRTRPSKSTASFTANAVHENLISRGAGLLSIIENPVVVAFATRDCTPESKRLIIA